MKNFPKVKNLIRGFPIVALQVKNPTLIVSVRIWVPSLASFSGLRISIATSCSIGCRGSSDLVWLRL